jgi:adenylyltransferase/sulfurtransferase
MAPLQVSVTETKRRLDAAEIALHGLPGAERTCDCRDSGRYADPDEYDSRNLQAIEAMTDSSDIVVYCHHGVRSLNVVNWLRQQGIPNVQSMEGGIDAWSVLIDPAVARY